MGEWASTADDSTVMGGIVKVVIDSTDKVGGIAVGHGPATWSEGSDGTDKSGGKFASLSTVTLVRVPALFNTYLAPKACYASRIAIRWINHTAREGLTDSHEH